MQGSLPLCGTEQTKTMLGKLPFVGSFLPDPKSTQKVQHAAGAGKVSKTVEIGLLACYTGVDPQNLRQEVRHEECLYRVFRYAL